MRVIAKKAIVDFIEKNPKSEKVLLSWYKTILAIKAENFAQLKLTFNSVDLVDKYIIFDVGGNKYRIITAIHFHKVHPRLYIRRILTHKEYDELNETSKLKEGEL